MERGSFLSFTSSGAPHHPSSLSVSSIASNTHQHGRGRGVIRPTQRSLASTSLQHESSVNCTAGDGLIDDTQTSLLLTDEELRQNVERQAKRLRQLQARESRQRSILENEAMQQLDQLLALSHAYASIAGTCVALRTAREAKRQHDEQQSQQWSLQLLADAVQDVVRQEGVSRHGILHAEAAVRETMAQLQAAETRALSFHEGVFRLLKAEQVRRAFLLREEARAVEAMGIPHFIALPCVSVAAPFSQDGVDRRRTLSELDKIDLMAGERCPFRCAADCPYMPPRTRQLGTLWAAGAAGGAARGGHGATASTSDPQRRQITEVGRQRVRYAMAKQHLHETTNFLPSLRVSF